MLDIIGRFTRLQYEVNNYVFIIKRDKEKYMGCYQLEEAVGSQDAYSPWVEISKESVEHVLRVRDVVISYK